MQCVSCRFENMPGVDACGRCGSPLRLATAVIDVQPPRATRWQKRWRRLFPVRRTATRAREALREVNQRTGSFIAAHDLPVPPGDVLLRMPVPGWAHYHIGERVTGRVYAGVYLTLLLLGLVLAGTFVGSVLLGLAFSVHASSILSILFRYGVEGWGRLRAGFYVLVLLNLVYLPLGWAFYQVAQPVTLGDVGAPLFENDVLWLNRSAYLFSPPRAGDVVLYNADSLRTANRYPAMYIAGGPRIDRILAGPGDEVAWDGTRLIVNGVESPLKPLNPALAMGTVKLRVDPGHYFIIPTTFPSVNPRTPDFWKSQCLVSAARIDGKLYLRTQPFSRFGRIH
jgi:hypothetical protein